MDRAAAQPDGLTLSATDAKPAKALIKHALAISLPIKGAASKLILTEAGRAERATGDKPVNEAPPPDASDPPAVDQPAADPATPKGKLGALVTLLRRPAGASLPDMMAATGWQSHSIRGAISGALKKKLGLAIESEKTGAERIYRIAVPKIASDDADAGAAA